MPVHIFDNLAIRCWFNSKREFIPIFHKVVPIISTLRVPIDLRSPQLGSQTAQGPKPIGDNGSDYFDIGSEFLTVVVSFWQR